MMAATVRQAWLSENAVASANSMTHTEWGECSERVERAGVTACAAPSSCKRGRISVVVAVLAMHMLVRDLLFGGGAHVGDRHGKAKVLAGQRVVAVEHDDVALDFHHVEDLLAAIVAAAFQLPADLDAGRKLGFGNGAHQALIA